jgi:hypothetical protein
MLLSLNHRLFGCDIVKSKTVSTKSEMNYKLFILPLTLITYGTIGIESDDLKIFNSEVKEEINENIDENLTIDDYSQYIPFLSVYALNKVGVRGFNKSRKTRWFYKKLISIRTHSYSFYGSRIFIPGIQT